MTGPRHDPWPVPLPWEPDPDEDLGDAAGNDTDGDPCFRPPESPARP